MPPKLTQKVVESEPKKPSNLSNEECGERPTDSDEEYVPLAKRIGTKRRHNSENDFRISWRELVDGVREFVKGTYKRKPFDRIDHPVFLSFTDNDGTIRFRESTSKLEWEAREEEKERQVRQEYERQLREGTLSEITHQEGYFPRPKVWHYPDDTVVGIAGQFGQEDDSGENDSHSGAANQQEDLDVTSASTKSFDQGERMDGDNGIHGGTTEGNGDGPGGADADTNGREPGEPDSTRGARPRTTAPRPSTSEVPDLVRDTSSDGSDRGEPIYLTSELAQYPGESRPRTPNEFRNDPERQFARLGPQIEQRIRDIRQTRQRLARVLGQARCPAPYQQALAQRRARRGGRMGYEEPFGMAALAAVAVVYLLFFVKGVMMKSTDTAPFFQHTGTLFPATTVGHILVPHNVSELLKTWEHLEQTIMGFEKYSIAKNVPKNLVAIFQFKKIKIEKDLKRMKTMIEKKDSRTERQAVLAFLGGIITTWVGSLFLSGHENQALRDSINAIGTNQEHIVKILEKTRHQVHEQDHKIELINSTIRELAMDLEETRTTARWKEDAIVYYHAIEEFGLMVDTHLQALEFAFNGRLAPSTISPDLIKNALQDLEDKATRKGFRLFTTDAVHLYEMRAKWLKTDYGFAVAIEIPMINPNMRFTLLRYLGTPFMELHSKTLFYPELEHDLVGISEDHEGSIFMTQSELDRCKLLADIWVCENTPVVYKVQPSRCIRALLSYDNNGIHNYCKMKASKNLFEVIRIKGNRFFLFSIDEISINIRCPATTDKTISFSGVYNLTLSYGCSAQSPSWTLWGMDSPISIETEAMPTVEIPFILPLPNDTEPHEWERIVEAAKKTTKPMEETIQLLELEKWRSNYENPLTSTMTFSTIAIALFLFLAFLLYMRKRFCNQAFPLPTTGCSGCSVLPPYPRDIEDLDANDDDEREPRFVHPPTALSTGDYVPPV